MPAVKTRRSMTYAGSSPPLPEQPNEITGQRLEKVSSNMNSKAEYVRRQPQSRNHTCHWPGCERQVPPAMWGCKEHWFKLPKALRDAVWKAYRPGQEINMTPSAEYIAVATLVQAWIAGDVTVNRDGSIVVHKDIPVPGPQR